MIEVAIMRVRPEQVERLRGWLAELMDRADEVRETFANEGVTHERAYLLPAENPPVLIYVMEAADHQKAREAYQHSTIPVDQEHRKVMRDCGRGLGSLFAGSAGCRAPASRVRFAAFGALDSGFRARAAGARWLRTFVQ